MNKNEVIQSSLIRSIAKLFVPQQKYQFRMLDFHDSDYWIDYKMKREKSTLYNKKLLFKDTGVVFTLKGDILSMITDYDFIETNSPVAKQITDLMDEMFLDIRAKGKFSKDNIVIINYFNRRDIISSELRTIFLSENINELSDRFKLILQEKQAGKYSNVNDEEKVALNIRLLQYKGLTPTQHKKSIKSFFFYNIL